MENRQITLTEIYFELKNLENMLKQRETLNLGKISENKNSAVKVLADEKLLAEDWLSEEDEEAWKDL